MSQHYLQLATLLHFATQPPPRGRVIHDASWRHYIHVLEEQPRQLRDELSEIVAPFTLALRWLDVAQDYT